MKPEDHIRIAHHYYKRISDEMLEFLRAGGRLVLDEGTHARNEISGLYSRFRDKQYALEYVMPELRESRDEKS